MSANSSAGFRRDINALRAWAVVSVVLFHFGVPGVGGGFAGVDVFFVISGFLMTGIISRGLAAGDFSFWHFYLSRANRILPALMVLCLVLMAAGAFFLLTEEYRQLGRHVRDSLLFSSNLRYLAEAGYFDTDSARKWLLHSWSLSVEWQFYLLLPLLMGLVVRWRPTNRNVMVAVLGVVMLLSLIWCIWLTPQDASRAFYQIQSRGWEMLVGGLVFFASERVSRYHLARHVLEWLGMAMMVLSFVLFAYDDRWPGWHALLPVLASAFVILAGGNGAWWGGRIGQWLGTRSYSLYLWHWPLVVTLLWLGRNDRPLWIVSGIVLSLLLGHLSYRWIEVPSRRYLSILGAGRAVLYLLLGVAVLAFVAQVIRVDGFPARLPEAVVRLEAAADNRNPRREECLNEDRVCRYGGDDIAAVMLGDSHADATVNALVASLPSAGQGVLFHGTGGCLFVFGALSVEHPKQCNTLLIWLKKNNDSLYPGVPMVRLDRTSYYVNDGLPGEPLANPGVPRVYFKHPHGSADASFRAAFRQHYIDTACALARYRPLYLVRPIPEMGVNVPATMAHAQFLHRERQVSVSLEEYHRRQSFVWSVQNEARDRCGVHILNPLPYLCDDQRCYASHEGQPLYYDDDHLNERGNRLLVPMFEQIFAGRTGKR